MRFNSLRDSTPRHATKNRRELLWKENDLYLYICPSGFRGQYFNLFINLRQGKGAGWSLTPTAPHLTLMLSLRVSEAAKLANVIKEKGTFFFFAHDTKCSDYNTFSKKLPTALTERLFLPTRVTSSRPLCATLFLIVPVGVMSSGAPGRVLHCSVG